MTLVELRARYEAGWKLRIGTWRSGRFIKKGIVSAYDISLADAMSNEWEVYTPTFKEWLALLADCAPEDRWEDYDYSNFDSAREHGYHNAVQDIFNKYQEFEGE